ncbi:hypothetical protein BGW41_004724 [Actinomortierella wolfii]|nr:hypothetical protein BGW41_004724 [Actinomortierella wolfii]
MDVPTTAFERAAEFVKASPRSTGTPDYDGMHAFSDEEELLLYGAYKQATVGDVKGPKPAFFDITARSKWQAWANMRGKSMDEAKAIYVDIVDQSLRKAAIERPELYAIADKITGRHASPPSTPEPTQDLDEKPLPPAPWQESTSSADAADTPTFSLRQSNLNHSQSSIHRPYGFHPARKGSFSHSIASTATGLQSAAASVYELASDQLTETPAAAEEKEKEEDDGIDDSDLDDAEGDDDDDVYQSSEEYGDEAEIAAEHEAARLAEEQQERENREQEIERNAALAKAAGNLADAVDVTIPPFLSRPSRSLSRTALPQPRDDLIDEGVFDEEDKVEDEALQLEEQQQQPHQQDAEDPEDPEVATVLYHRDAPEAVVLEDMEAAADEDEDALRMYGMGSLKDEDKPSSPVVDFGTTPTKSRTSSVSSSGYGGSVASKSQSPLLEHPPKDLPWSRTTTTTSVSKADQILSPPAAAQPYVVRTMTETSSSYKPTPPQDEEQKESSSSAPTNHTSSSPLPSSFHPEGAVCPVTKKTSAEGMCPAAMFAMAREARQKGADDNSNSNSTSTSTLPHLPGVSRTPPPPLSSTQSGPKSGDVNTTASPSTSTPSRSRTEPVLDAHTSSSPPPSQQGMSQSKRLGQGIVSRFSAFRSSLAAASARAASSALSSFPASASSLSSSLSSMPTTATTTALLHSDTGSNVSRLTAVDPLTQQSVTVICPHGHQTSVFERELEHLQNEVTALTERLRLLQESLEHKSLTRAQEKRSARGILMMVLRQGLINAVLLLIVFGILYRRRSPIAFAILAYIGQGRKEGEAGWRALMRWIARWIRIGRRNQRYVLSAGRRNGYW